MGRATRCEPGEYLRHFADATPEMFDLHTAETYEDAKRLLRAEARHGSKASLARLCQVSGISYQETGVLWDDHLAAFANRVDNTFWDWMHILVASGGTLQYECNELLRALSGVGVSLLDLDTLSRRSLGQKGAACSPRRSFQSVTCRNPGPTSTPSEAK